MRIPMIAGNWKMNTTVSEAIKLVNEILPGINTFNTVEKVICPPFISLTSVHSIIQNTNIKLGAQNLFYAEKGAYTGEISPLMLAGYCEYVILGHSERRQYFNETGELISKKIVSALNNKIKPILCVGENLAEYEAGLTHSVVTGQLDSSLKDISDANLLTIAYEPIWAIGTGKAASGEQANATIELIRHFLSNKFGANIAEKARILYGGSVTTANILEYVSKPQIDGALVGGASLKAKDFIEIVRITSTVSKPN